jgi:hypothetical protein
MSEKDLKGTTPKETTANCGCGKTGSGPSCPCKRRFCLPILGLVSLAVVATVAAKRRNRE